MTRCGDALRDTDQVIAARVTEDLRLVVSDGCGWLAFRLDGPIESYNVEVISRMDRHASRDRSGMMRPSRLARPGVVAWLCGTSSHEGRI